MNRPFLSCNRLAAADIVRAAFGGIAAERIAIRICGIIRIPPPASARP